LDVLQTNKKKLWTNLVNFFFVLNQLPPRCDPLHFFKDESGDDMAFRFVQKKKFKYEMPNQHFIDSKKL